MAKTKKRSKRKKKKAAKRRKRTPKKKGLALFSKKGLKELLKPKNLIHVIALAALFVLILYPQKEEQKPKKMARSANPKLVFVIDDIGYHLKHEKELAALGDNVTYAILPLLPYSRLFGRLSRETGAEVILHQPMETVDGTVPGKGLITSQMDDAHVRDVLSRNLFTVPNHSGINNHMGSRGTSNPRIMRVVLKEAKRRGLLFLDSYTTPESVAVRIGKQMNMPILTRNVFLDNVDTRPAIQKQLRTMTNIARGNKYAIGIGHYRKNTLDVLAEEIPRLKREGFEIISLKELLNELY